MMNKKMLVIMASTGAALGVIGYKGYKAIRNKFFKKETLEEVVIDEAKVREAREIQVVVEENEIENLEEPTDEVEDEGISVEEIKEVAEKMGIKVTEKKPSRGRRKKVEKEEIAEQTEENTTEEGNENI